MAGAVELASALPEPVEAAAPRDAGLHRQAGPRPVHPWHTSRATITRLGDATVRCTDAWGRIANDVLTLSRPEIGELSEGTGGGSSTMPHKANPVLSTLVRRAALTTPQLAATLHLAAAEAADERSAGPWHAEWATAPDAASARRRRRRDQTPTCSAASGVHSDRMRRPWPRHGRRPRRAAQPGRAGRERARRSYLGASATFVEATLARAAVLVDAVPVPARAEESR